MPELNDGVMWTRIVLYLTFLWLLAWEGWALLRWGRRATISWVLGDVMNSDPLALMLALWFLLHCQQAARHFTP